MKNEFNELFNIYVITDLHKNIKKEIIFVNYDDLDSLVRRKKEYAIIRRSDLKLYKMKLFGPNAVPSVFTNLYDFCDDVFNLKIKDIDFEESKQKYKTFKDEFLKVEKAKLDLIEKNEDISPFI